MDAADASKGSVTISLPVLPRTITPEYVEWLRDIGASQDLVDFVDREVRASTTIRRRRRRLTSLLLRRRRR